MKEHLGRYQKRCGRRLALLAYRDATVTADSVESIWRTTKSCRLQPMIYDLTLGTFL